MAEYRNEDLDGAEGAVGSAAAIGMDSKTGTLTFDPPGWRTLETGLRYESAGTTSSADLDDTFSGLVRVKVTVRIDGAPSATCPFMSWLKADGASIARVQMLTTGQIEVHGPFAEDVQTSVGTYTANEWLRLVVEVNQDRSVGGVGRSRMKLLIYDNDRTLMEPAISCEIGGQPITKYREGVINNVTWAIKLSTFLMQDEPCYIEQEQDPSLWRDNVVYGMFDDASANIFLHCGELIDLADSGYTFVNNFLTTPLCSPCRASIYTGQHPQNNGVFGNSGQADWDANPDNALRAYWRRLSDSGVVVAQLGKHLNGANENDQTPLGMDVALITDSGTHQFDYQYRWDWFGDVEIVDTTDTANALEAEYLTDVMAGKVAEFLAYMDAERPGQPFALFLAPYVTHSGAGTDPDPDSDASRGSPPAPRDRFATGTEPANWADPEFPTKGDLGPGQPDPGDISWPDYYSPEHVPNWNTVPVPTPGWYTRDEDGNILLLSGATLDSYELNHHNRIRAAQSFDDLIADVRADLATYDMDDRTWIMLSSDNGFHLGEHATPQGKGMATMDHDVRIPVIVHPPGGLDGPVALTALIQPIDLLPTWMEIAGITPDLTTIDGRSWLGFVTGAPPTEWRQTALIQYGKPGEDTWEGHLGSGDPAPMTVLRTVDATLGSYDRGNPGSVPTSELGEAYDNATDPAQLLNIFGLVPSYRLIPAFNQMGAYYNGVGETSWEQALLPFSLTSGEPEEGPFWVLGGTDMTDPSDRFYTLLDGTRKPSIPGLSTNRLDDTEDEDDPGYDTATPHGKATMVLNQRVTDRDEQGNKGGASLFDINKVALESVVTPAGRRFPVGMRPTRTSGVEWESTGKILGALEYQDSGMPTTEDVKLPIQLTRPFRSLIVATWSIPFRGNIGIAHITSLAGGSAPVRGALIKIRGPIRNLERITDYASSLATGNGWEMSWNGWDLGAVEVTESPQQWLLIDTRNWIARLKTTNDWDLTTGTNVGAFLRATGGQPDLLRLHHVEWEGDPRDRRYLITAEGTARNDNTELAIQSYRWRY